MISSNKELFLFFEKIDENYSDLQIFLSKTNEKLSQNFGDIVDGILKSIDFFLNIFDLTSSNHECKETLSNLSDKLKNFKNSKAEIRMLIKQWVPKREKSISNLINLVNEMDNHHENCNISNVVGSSVSLVGGIFSIIGGIASFPFTAGTSAVLVAGGISCMTAGGITAGGASITDALIIKSKCKSARELIDNDFEELKKLLEKINEFKIDFENLMEEVLLNYKKYNQHIKEQLENSKMEQFRIGFSGVQIAWDIFSGLYDLYSLFGSGKLNEVLKENFQCGKNIYTGLIAFGMILDVWNIISTTIDLCKGSKTDAGKELLRFTDQLEKQKEDFKTI